MDAASQCINKDLIKQLVSDQLPHLKHLTVREIKSYGTQNILYRLGCDKLIRCARTEAASKNLIKEAEWLPKLESGLPINIPSIEYVGKPCKRYPYCWLMMPWQEGDNPSNENPVNELQAAIDLAAFLSAMKQLKPTGGPYCLRGDTLQHRDQQTRHEAGRGAGCKYRARCLHRVCCN